MIENWQSFINCLYPNSGEFWGSLRVRTRQHLLG